MQRYLDVVQGLARRIAAGEPRAGAALPGVRPLGERYGVAPATVGRALQELARAGVVVTHPRRGATVAPHGRQRAARLLRGGPALRLAGSDDPALAVLLDAAGVVERVATPGSVGGLIALWQGTADAAALHLRHADGTYNDPFVARMLADRAPVVVRLWRREQGILLRPEDAGSIRDLADLAGRTVALRPPGTGTRVLLDRLLRERGVDPTSVAGPAAATHLDVALTVAAGAAEAGLAVRSAAALLGLTFLPVAWEPFDLALPAEALPAAESLRLALADPAVQERIAGLDGYDLEETGTLRKVG